MSFEYINELDPKYEISKLNDPDSREYWELWAKTQSVKDSLDSYYKGRKEIGLRCQQYMNREIFTEEQIAAFTADDKVPVEPQLMKPAINALWSHIIASRKKGHVITEDSNIPPNAADPVVVDAVIKKKWYDFDLDTKTENALREGLVTGWPIWVWFDLVTDYDIERLQCHLYPWDAVLPGRFYNHDGSDINECFLFSIVNKAELIELYPDREEIIEKHKDLMIDEAIFSKAEFYESTTAYDWSTIFQEVISAYTDTLNNSQYLLQRHIFPGREKCKKWINYKTDKLITIPSTWDSKRKQEWLNNNPDFTEINTDFRVLWETVTTSNGLVLKNEKHWFQEDWQEHKAILPGYCYIADTVNRLPTSPAHDMLPLIFSAAVSQTEGLSQVQKGTGSVTFLQEGALKNPEEFKEEMTKDNGLVVMNEGYDPRDVINLQRTPNGTFLEYAELQKRELEETHHINESMRGLTNPGQSGVSKRTEVQQGLTVQAPYIKHYTDFVLKIYNLMILLMPYHTKEDEIIQIDDEFGNTQKFDVNVTEQQLQFKDGESGEAEYQAKIVANDLTSVRYRFVIEPGDNSYTGHQLQQGQFMVILEAIGNSILNTDPLMAANFLMTWNNKFAKQAGQQMLKLAEQQQQAAMQQSQENIQAQQQVEAMKQQVELTKATLPNIVASLKPQDIEESPDGFRALVALINSMLPEKGTVE